MGLRFIWDVSSWNNELNLYCHTIPKLNFCRRKENIYFMLNNPLNVHKTNRYLEAELDFGSSSPYLGTSQNGSVGEQDPDWSGSDTGNVLKGPVGEPNVPRQIIVSSLMWKHGVPPYLDRMVYILRLKNYIIQKIHDFAIVQ